MNFVGGWYTMLFPPVHCMRQCTPMASLWMNHWSITSSCLSHGVFLGFWTQSPGGAASRRENYTMTFSVHFTPATSKSTGTNRVSFHFNNLCSSFREDTRTTPSQHKVEFVAGSDWACFCWPVSRVWIATTASWVVGVWGPYGTTVPHNKIYTLLLRITALAAIILLSLLFYA